VSDSGKADSHVDAHNVNFQSKFSDSASNNMVGGLPTEIGVLEKLTQLNLCKLC
jgi:hypothetical protein